MAIRRILALIVLSVSAVLGASVLSGCNIVGAALLIAEGPPKIDRVYKLDDELTGVVFVDDRANRLPRRDLRRAIAEAAERELRDRKLLSEVVASREAFAAASRDRYGDPMPISEIGQTVGADVVIYITVDSFVLTPDGQTLAPTAILRVKVIDARAHARLWPEQRDGHEVTAGMPRQTGSFPRDRGARTELTTQLAEIAGLGVAQVFYTHEAQRSAARGG